MMKDPIKVFRMIWSCVYHSIYNHYLSILIRIGWFISRLSPVFMYVSILHLMFIYVCSPLSHIEFVVWRILICQEYRINRCWSRRVRLQSPNTCVHSIYITSESNKRKNFNNWHLKYRAITMFFIFIFLQIPSLYST